MDSVAEIVAILQGAFPDGVDDSEYLGVIACLYEDMSDENLSKAVAQFSGRNRVDVSNDIPLARSFCDANRDAVDWIAARLRTAGWEPDEESD